MHEAGQARHPEGRSGQWVQSLAAMNDTNARDSDSRDATEIRRRLPWWVWLVLAVMLAGAIVTFLTWPNRAEAVGVWVGAASVLIAGSTVAVRVKETGGRIVEGVREAGESVTSAVEEFSMSEKMLTDDQMAEILASAQALTNMPPEERRAAELLKELLGGEYTPRDTGGAQGMHDFDLRLDDGATFAVEVTTDASRVDRAFWHQIDQINPLELPGLTRVWRVDVSTPGDGPDDQQASHRRVKALQTQLPDILRQLEGAGLTTLRVPPSPHRDNHEAQGRLRDLGVQSCFSYDASPDENPRVLFGGASVSGHTGPSMIMEAVNENLPKKVKKLLDAKTAGAAEAHLFLWLNFGEEHKRGRADAMSFLAYTGLDQLEPINLHGIDAVWVAVDAGPSHAPDCRHTWPILCFDADGWHDWQLRRSR